MESAKFPTNAVDQLLVGITGLPLVCLVDSAAMSVWIIAFAIAAESRHFSAM